ncbi:hypothetical protein ACTWP6_29230 [Mycobacterium sp. 4D054]|uniref:hypothetical protein n=1 Tax=unclassified Mycobacterium TaxID=2642494 RepID=UPI0021B3F75E|nr:hypothetical protein [Mycobacterium sp. SMC-8]UXA11791.1 hypothetical protein KXD97_28150 [Mycobacterium sp. SMC-8]
MSERIKSGAAVVAFVAAAAGLLIQTATAVVAQAQEPVCPAGTYWDAATATCIAVNVYVNPPNPVIGPAGPIGVGGVVGPVGPGPVGPGPVGPGPLGPGPR